MSPDTERQDDQSADGQEQGHQHDHDHDHEGGHDHGHDHESGHDPEQGEELLPQTVEVNDVGPCRKHLKVTVDRSVIDKRFDEKFTELVFSDSSQVAGFRPGKAPRKLIEKRYFKEVAEQIKNELLMVSLEQLATENKINPLSPPDLDINQIEIPKEGPMIYEFDVEVAPEFDLPPYKGLKLRKPVHNFSDEEIQRETKRILEPQSQIVPKEPKDGGEPTVERDDLITADVTIRYGDQILNDLKEARVRVDRRLVLSDAIAENFDKQLAGAKAGEERTVKIKLSPNSANTLLRGKEVDAVFQILDIKTLRSPDLTDEFLNEEFGVTNKDQFEELIRGALENRLAYQQRQAARQQILDQLAESQNLELPRDLLRKQAQRSLSRKVMEMRSQGLSEAQIDHRLRLMQQDVIQSTAAAMKEHFVLQKIAELEKIEVSDDDIEDEIERIAMRADESPRRVRARLEKEDMIETLATELLERRALDLVLESAEYEEYELAADEEEEESAALEAQAVPGTAEDESDEVAEGAPAEEDEKKENA